MDYAKYSDLKGKSKQAFKKIAAVAEVKNDAGNITTHAVPEYIVIETKQYDTNTGEEKTASARTISLADLERDKERYTADKAAAQAQLTQINKMITDIKKV